MEQPVKFTFERRFGDRRGNPLVFEEKEPTLTVSAHEAALAEADRAAYARGFAEAQAATRAEESTRHADALEALRACMDRLSGELARLNAHAAGEAIRFGLAFARTLAAGLVSRFPLARIEDAARGIFADVRGAPHLALSVAPDLVTGARERVGALTRERGFEGRLVVLGDPEIAAGDAKLEWADGGVILDRAATERRIAAAVAELLATLPDSATLPESANLADSATPSTPEPQAPAR